MLDIDFFGEAPVLALQPFDIADVFESDGGNATDTRQKLDVACFEDIGRGAVDINNPEFRPEYRQRRADNGVHVVT